MKKQTIAKFREDKRRPVARLLCQHFFGDGADKQIIAELREEGGDPFHYMVGTATDCAVNPRLRKSDPAFQRPSTGCYYARRSPSGWYAFCWRDNQLGEIGHVELWRQHLVRFVAMNWRQKLNIDPRVVVKKLKDAAYAFPRGRVTNVGGKFIVHHGNNLLRSMRISRKEIEQAFGIVGRCRWEFDEHEQCLKEDKEAIRECLGIEDDWPAV